jgi:HK97 family phage major capsid protein
MTVALSTRATEYATEAKARIAQARAILEQDEQTAEDMEQFDKLTKEIDALKDKATKATMLERMVTEVGEWAAKTGGPPPVPGANPTGFKTLGELCISVHGALFGGHHDPRLKVFSDPNEPSHAPAPNVEGWVESKERKDLVENVGASGGFLVPLEQMTQLLQVPGPAAVVRPRCTVIPMRRRSITWPVLDQTNTTAGQPAWYGGVIAQWTEEGAAKDETEPSFRQIQLVAHKLVCYTEASDELLQDSAISLEALLSTVYQGAVTWYEEEAFMNGTGAGQPRGVINAPATFAQGRNTANTIVIQDPINMLEHFHGSNPVWLASRSTLPTLMQLNGPAANPSYVFMPNARDGMPATLFGYPLFWNEHCPLLGQRGDLGLYDFRMYLIADRQGTTIDASKHYRFQYDLTSWRAVHRVDGQPWLSQPIYLSDGTTQVSPFVVLDAATGS